MTQEEILSQLGGLSEQEVIEKFLAAKVAQRKANLKAYQKKAPEREAAKAQKAAQREAMKAYLNSLDPDFIKRLNAEARARAKAELAAEQNGSSEVVEQTENQTVSV